MQRKIDLGEDKNYFVPDPKAFEKPTLAFLADEFAKTADDAMNEARKVAWDSWVNSEPLLIGLVDDHGKSYLFYISEALKSKVVLIEIWDYTLLPCRRSMSYMKEWQKRYQASGLVCIGVHTPMFEFGKDKKNIQDACRDLGINYPVVMDNKFEIWKSLENRFWPRRVLLDANAKIHQECVGEGRYVEFEQSIQLLLRELSPGLACPPLVKPLRRADEPDFTAEPTTPEIFLGIKRKPKFASAKIPVAVGEEIHFKDESNENYALETLYFDGPWTATQESMYGAALHKGTIKVTVKFKGTDAYIVARSRSKIPAEFSQPLRPQVLIDKKPVADDKWGRDVSYNEYHRPSATIREPRLYHLASKLDFKEHVLSIQMDASGADALEIYGIFFEDSR